MRTRTLRNTVLGVGTALVLAACSTVSTTTSEQAVHVNGGVLLPVAKSILGCVKPADSEISSAGTSYATYPAGERTYKFAATSDADGKPVQIIKNNVPLTITGVVSFSLTQNCDDLKQFHTLIGSKVWAKDKDGNPIYGYVNDSYDGWNTMLDTYIEQAIQSAATAAAGQIQATYLEVYNGAGRTELEQAMQKLLPTYVAQLSGGNFFLNFRITVNKPSIDNPDILSAIAAKTTAQLQNEAQQQRNAAVQTELQSIKELVAVLGPQGYIDYVKNQLTKQQLDLLAQAITQGKIQILPIPQGSSVVVPSAK